MRTVIRDSIARLQTLITIPSIVCLCGSTKFYEEFMDENYKLTMDGCIVLSVGFFMHAKNNQHGGQVGATQKQKAELDVLHLRKIDLADAVHVVNVGGYVGASTKRELWYAVRQGKTLSWREPEKAYTREAIASLFPSWDAWQEAAETAAKV